MPLHVSKHPVVLDCLAGLRDKSTEPETFRDLARNAITFLLYEATADLPVRQGSVETPLKTAPAMTVDADVVAIPVLRAGLGLLAPVLELLPRVRVGYIGLSATRRRRWPGSTTTSCLRSKARSPCCSTPCWRPVDRVLRPST